MSKDMTPDEVEAKILHLLTLYPIISPTMLQGGLGPSVRPKLWRPVLTQLIEAGRVEEEQINAQTHSGRYNTYTRLSLSTLERDRQEEARAEDSVAIGG